MLIWTYANSNKTFVPARVSDKESKLINVAGSGIVTQDSTGWDGVASRAVDGIIDGNYFDGYFLITPTNTVISI